MLNKIKALADEAIKLQNKNRMDEVLREISAMCEPEKVVPILEELHTSYQIPKDVVDDIIGKPKVERAKHKGAKDAE